MRVLNHVVRVVPSGLRYEPDPRHVDLLAKAFNFQIGKANSQCTPGVKPRLEDVETEADSGENTHDLDELIAAVRLSKKVAGKVSFAKPERLTEFVNDAPSYYSIPAKTWLLNGPLGSLSGFHVDPTQCCIDAGLPFQNIGCTENMPRQN